MAEGFEGQAEGVGRCFPGLQTLLQGFSSMEVSSGCLRASLPALLTVMVPPLYKQRTTTHTTDSVHL